MIQAIVLTILLKSYAPVFDQALCCYFHEQEVHDYLKSLCPSLHITRGEYDEDARYPETKTLTIGQFKLGLCHGHQV